jgi:hypothetical protein
VTLLKTVCIMYHFVSLDDDQKHVRRLALDKFACIAQISDLIPLISLQCIFLTSFLRRRWIERQYARCPKSPNLKNEKHDDNSGFKDVEIRLRKFQWWLGEAVDVAGTSYGTRGQLLLTGCWTAWLLLLCFVETGDGETNQICPLPSINQHT